MAVSLPDRSRAAGKGLRRAVIAAISARPGLGRSSREMHLDMTRPFQESDLPWALALNAELEVELSPVTGERLLALVDRAFLARVIGPDRALLIAFDQDADYDSPNSCGSGSAIRASSMWTGSPSPPRAAGSRGCSTKICSRPPVTPATARSSARSTATRPTRPPTPSTPASDSRRWAGPSWAMASRCGICGLRYELRRAEMATEPRIMRSAQPSQPVIPAKAGIQCS